MMVKFNERHFFHTGEVPVYVIEVQEQGEGTGLKEGDLKMPLTPKVCRGAR